MLKTAHAYDYKNNALYVTKEEMDAEEYNKGPFNLDNLPSWKVESQNCTEINISTVTYIPAYSFYYFENVVKILLNDKLAEIGNYAFAGCKKLSQLNFPTYIQYVGISAFQWCYNLNFNDGLLNLSEYMNMPSLHLCKKCFGDCTAIKTLELPSQLDSLEIQVGAFENCRQLNKIVFRNINYIIATNIAQNNQYLTTVIFGKDVSSIPQKAFKGCTKLANISFQANVLTIIESQAFEGCIALQNINLPLLHYVGKYAFANCYNLKNINLNATNIIQIGAFLNCSNLEEVKIEVDSSHLITEIGDYTFMNCNLKTFSCPYSIKNIGDYAFYNNTNLITFEFSENLESIGNYAFFKCHLPYINITDSMTKIGNYSFARVSTEKITLGKNIQEIGDYAFRGVVSSSPFECLIPDSVTTIGSHAFYQFKGMTNLTLGNGIEKIGDYAFAEINCISTLILGTKVQAIGDYAFYKENISMIVFHSNVKEIGKSIVEPEKSEFYTVRLCANGNKIFTNFIKGNKAISEVILDGIPNVPQSAFQSCVNLKTVRVPHETPSLFRNPLLTAKYSQKYVK